MNKILIATMILVVLAMAAPGLAQNMDKGEKVGVDAKFIPPGQAKKMGLTTIDVKSVPEIDTSSTAIALGLLAGAVLVVFEVRKRKKQTPPQT